MLPFGPGLLQLLLRGSHLAHDLVAPAVQLRDADVARDEAQALAPAANIGIQRIQLRHQLTQSRLELFLLLVPERILLPQRRLRLARLGQLLVGCLARCRDQLLPQRAAPRLERLSLDDAALLHLTPQTRRDVVVVLKDLIC